MQQSRETGMLTIAAIRRRKGRAATEYLFNERQQIFTLTSVPRSGKRSAGRPAARSTPALSKSLEQAFRRKLPVKAVLDPRRAAIERVDLPSPRELDEFFRLRTLLDKPEKTVRIDVSDIDPTTFNIADRYLKVPTFRLCTRIIPSYKKAKEIFDFCADQSCHLPGPYDISPCIPFQYVIDGCYARAHKMRRIITTRYRYCCEKVFSFANQDDDRLAVRADKWGGCCVSWWYHVAPLVRVRITLRPLKISLVVALVIDPGMFNKPVLLSSWLAAQENTNCDADAKVSMYSIQPGSAYSPANYAGTAFTTDPSYTATDATLTAYSNLTTCP
jgi:hypothetical protein